MNRFFLQINHGGDFLEIRLGFLGNSICADYLHRKKDFRHRILPRGQFTYAIYVLASRSGALIREFSSIDAKEILNTWRERQIGSSGRLRHSRFSSPSRTLLPGVRAKLYNCIFVHRAFFRKKNTRCLCLLCVFFVLTHTKTMISRPIEQRFLEGSGKVPILLRSCILRCALGQTRCNGKGHICGGKGKTAPNIGIISRIYLNHRLPSVCFEYSSLFNVEPRWDCVAPKQN